MPTQEEERLQRIENCKLAIKKLEGVYGGYNKLKLNLTDPAAVRSQLNDIFTAFKDSIAQLSDFAQTIGANDTQILDELSDQFDRARLNVVDYLLATIEEAIIELQEDNEDTSALEAVYLVVRDDFVRRSDFLTVVERKQFRDRIMVLNEQMKKSTAAVEKPSNSVVPETVVNSTDELEETIRLIEGTIANPPTTPFDPNASFQGSSSSYVALEQVLDVFHTSTDLWVQHYDRKGSPEFEETKAYDRIKQLILRAEKLKQRLVENDPEFIALRQLLAQTNQEIADGKITLDGVQDNSAILQQFTNLRTQLHANLQSRIGLSAIADSMLVDVDALRSRIEFSEWQRTLEMTHPELRALRERCDLVVLPSPTPTTDRQEVADALRIARDAVRPRNYTVPHQPHLESHYFSTAEAILAQLDGALTTQENARRVTDFNTRVVNLERVITSIPLRRDGRQEETLLKLRESLEAEYKLVDDAGILEEKADQPNEINTRIRTIVKDVTAARQRLQHLLDEFTPQLRQYLKKSAHELLKMYFTHDVNQVDRNTLYYPATKEKLQELRQVFIDHYLALPAGTEYNLRGHVTTSDDRDDREKAAIERWEDLSKVYELSQGLIEYNVFSVKTLHTADLTCNHKLMIGESTSDRGAAGSDKAPSVNAAFNESMLVGADGIDRHDLYSDHMGLVQMIEFAALQQMKSARGPYSRNKGWGDGLSEHLIEFVCNLEQVPTFDGRVLPINIKKEMQKYPKDVHELIRLLALLKCSRDDIGSKAAIHHLGVNKGALKINLGSETRPHGVMASILYQVGKNSARENHCAMLDWVDLTGSVMMQAGRPANPADWQDYTKWTDPNNREVVRMAAEMANFRRWSHPQWPNIQFDTYQPQREDDDYPDLAHFMNQTENPYSTGHYIKSRDAMTKIIEMAIESRTATLKKDHALAVAKVQAMVKDFSSEIGKVLSYLEKPPGFDIVDGAVVPSADQAKFPELHQEVLAAFEYFLANLLMAVPAKVHRFDHAGLDMDRSYHEYLALLKAVKIAIVEEIKKNGTLKGYYQYKLIGYLATDAGSHQEPDGGFLGQDGFTRVFRDEDDLRIEFQDWRIKNDPTLKGIGYFERRRVYDSSPKDPVNTAGGWKSSYDVGTKK